jgi:hypothetical protein
MRAIIEIHSERNLVFHELVYGLHQLYQPILVRFMEGALAAIGFVDYSETAIALRIYGSAAFFAAAKELGILAAQQHADLKIKLDFTGFGAAISSFTASERLKKNSLASEVASISLVPPKK